MSTVQSNEHWNNYVLDDGSIIRMKLVVTEFARIDGEFDSEGNPVYFIKSTQVTSVDPAENLRKQQ